MPVDSPGLGTWQIVKPVAATNLVTNPSFEVATTGWAVVGSTITRTAGAGVFGGYGGRLLASVTSGYSEFTCAAVASGSANVASAWVRSASSSVVLQLLIGASNAAVAHPGDGLWHRLETPITAPSATTPVVRILDNRAAAWTNVDIDGVMVETGVSVASTYVDGDQDGCIWNGTSHLSTSTRDGRDARGGSLVSLASLGWTEKTWGGVGSPDVDTVSQDYALTDGSLYQNQHAKPRVITLSALAQAANLAALHAARRALLDAFNPNARTNRGPVRLRYAGAAVVKVIDAVNESGFGFDKPYHQRAEMAEMRFLAPDPVWSSETDTEAALVTNQNLTSTGYVVQRGADGTWSSLSGGVAGTGTVVYVIAEGQDGKLYVGGTWTAGAASTAYLAVWNGSAWAQVGGVNPNNTVRGIAVGPDGNLLVVGSFSTIGAAFVGVAIYNPSTATWSALGGMGTNSAFCCALDVNGVPWVGGSTAVSAQFASFWNGASWTNATGLGGAGGVNAIVRGGDGYLYAATDTGVFRTSGSAFSSIGTAAGGAVFALAFGADGRLYAGGTFTSLGGVAAARVARWNGATWSALSSGMTAGAVNALAVAADGSLVASGATWTAAGGVSVPAPVAAWNGSSWHPIDISLPTGASNVSRALFAHRSGALTVGWGNSGTAVVPVPTTVTNTGSADAYPIITFQTGGAVYSFINYTTGKRIDFSLTNQGSSLTIDLRPGVKTVRSPWKSELPGVVPGSDFATWALVPGDNRVAMFQAAGVNAAMWWRSRFWSVD